ncbi:MAG: DUF3293 domain-containing protein [Actinomycetales bacterium]|nr:DUF3293 domain-containing protein [Actinomycetales bacterium]
MVTRQELFEQYQAAIVSTQDPDLGWTDPALLCMRRAQSAVVLTAWNPGFDRPGAQANRERNRMLGQRLEDAGFEAWPADGADPDGSFAEEGFLVWGMPIDQACALAGEFGQFAVFAYDSEGVRSVVPC